MLGFLYDKVTFWSTNRVIRSLRETVLLNGTMFLRVLHHNEFFRTYTPWESKRTPNRHDPEPFNNPLKLPERPYSRSHSCPGILDRSWPAPVENRILLCLWLRFCLEPTSTKVLLLMSTKTKLTFLVLWSLSLYIGTDTFTYILTPRLINFDDYPNLFEFCGHYGFARETEREPCRERFRLVSIKFSYSPFSRWMT